MINYDLSLIRAVIFDVDGVLSCSTVPMTSAGIPLRTANIKDGFAIQLAVKMGLHIAIITGASTSAEAVTARFSALGVSDIFVAAARKLDALSSFTSKYSLSREEVIYVGDDIPDLEALRAVACPCCPADACPEVQQLSIYVSTHQGGRGVARDILEQVLRAQNKWNISSASSVW